MKIFVYIKRGFHKPRARCGATKSLKIESRRRDLANVVNFHKKNGAQICLFTSQKESFDFIFVYYFLFTFTTQSGHFSTSFCLLSRFSLFWLVNLFLVAFGRKKRFWKLEISNSQKRSVALSCAHTLCTKKIVYWH